MSNKDAKVSEAELPMPPAVEAFIGALEEWKGKKPDEPRGSNMFGDDSDNEDQIGKPANTKKAEAVAVNVVKVLPWVVVGAGGLGAGKTSGAGTRGVSLDVVIGCRTGHSDTNGGESSDNRSKVHADCGPAENPSL